jgi:hypothetical protein
VHVVKLWLPAARHPEAAGSLTGKMAGLQGGLFAGATSAVTK